MVRSVVSISLQLVLSAWLAPHLLKAQTPLPLQGIQLASLNSIIGQLESAGWDSDGDGSLDAGIVEVLFVALGHPLYGELQVELAGAGLTMDPKTRECIRQALDGLKKAAEGVPDGTDPQGRVKRVSRVVVTTELKGAAEADTSPNEGPDQNGKQKHTAEKCTGKERIRLSPESADLLGHQLPIIHPVLMHEGKRTCQVLEICNVKKLTAAEEAEKKKLDCEAANTQILIWIALKLATKVRGAEPPPPAQQPKSHRLACVMLKSAIEIKKKL
jgi:hypothetical protein